MTSPYLTLVPRSEAQARAEREAKFAPSRLADNSGLKFERQRTDARFRDLEKLPVQESWAALAIQTVCFLIFLAAVIGAMVLVNQ